MSALPGADNLHIRNHYRGSFPHNFFETIGSSASIHKQHPINQQVPGVARLLLLIPNTSNCNQALEYLREKIQLIIPQLRWTLMPCARSSLVPGHRCIGHDQLTLPVTEQQYFTTKKAKQANGVLKWPQPEKITKKNYRSAV